MPTTATEYAQTAQEQTLTTIRQTQQAVVEAVRSWASAVEKSVPEIPAAPFAEQLPSAQEVVQTSFDFAEQLLKAQREFAESVLAAAAPVLEKQKSPAKAS
jgi:hypothetical protein